MASKKSKFWDSSKMDTSKMDMKSINPPDTKGDYSVTRGLIKGKDLVEAATKSFRPTLLGQGMGGRVASDPIRDPRQYSNLVCWADMSVQSYVNNAQISTIIDRSGLGNNLTQATGSKQPLFITDAFGVGLHAARFDGIDDFIKSVVYGGAGTGCSFGGVCKLITNVAGNPEFCEVASASGRGLFRSTAQSKWTTNNGASEVNGTISALGATVVVIAVHDGTASQVSFYVDGILYTGSFATGATDALTLGANGPGAANFSNIDIGDAFSYQRILTPGEVGGLHR